MAQHYPCCSVSPVHGLQRVFFRNVGLGWRVLKCRIANEFGWSRSSTSKVADTQRTRTIKFCVSSSGASALHSVCGTCAKKISFSHYVSRFGWRLPCASEFHVVSTFSEDDSFTMQCVSILEVDSATLGPRLEAPVSIPVVPNTPDVPRRLGQRKTHLTRTSTLTRT